VNAEASVPHYTSNVQYWNL